MRNVIDGVGKTVTSLVMLAAVAGCSTPQQPAASAAAAAESFSRLRPLLASRHQQTAQIDLKLAALPRTLEIARTGPDGVDDFSAWCRRSNGRENSQEPVARRDARLAELVYRTNVQGPIHELRGSFCTFGDNTYAHFVADGFNKATQYKRAVWFSPEDIQAFGPAAEAKFEAERRGRLEAEDRRRNELVALRSKEIERRQTETLEFLRTAPKGTQMSCSSPQAQGDRVSDLVFECGERFVKHALFGEHGWRITSQSAAPDLTSPNSQTFQVYLVVEKTR